jgi:hypothetical protein
MRIASRIVRICNNALNACAGIYDEEHRGPASSPLIDVGQRAFGCVLLSERLGALIPHTSWEPPWIVAQE